jgi:hypothetical protein
VPVEALVDELVQLPVPQTASAKPTVNSPRHVVSAKRLLPAPRLAKTSPGTQFRQMAKTADPARGLVLDYVTVNATRTNFVFQGDSTYYISGPIMLWGTNTFEGGTVIKYAANAGITIAPTMIPCGIKWQAGPYCPVVFTAKDDNSVGELISDSTGTPTGYYANAALYLVAPSGVTNISNFRVSYAKQAIFYTGNSLYFNNGQFINCLNGFSVGGASPLYLRNMLFANVQTNFNQLYSGQFNIQNSTFCGSSYLMTIKDQSGQSSTLSLTNCILVNVANCQTNGPSPGSYWVAGGFNGFYNSFTLGNNQISAASYPFQVVGAGSYYLTNGCGFQNVGTTNMDSTLRAALRQRTTCSPIVYSNVTISAATTFSPQATRDTDAPDLGYHYDPLDYVFGGVNAYSNVTFTAGTAMGWFNGGPGAPYSQGYGIALYGSSRANFNGTATNPCVLSRNSMVQEGGNGIWTAGAYLGGFIGLGGNYTEATAPTVALQFTRCFARPYEGQYFRDKGDGTLIVIRANNCEFYSGGAGGYLMYFNYTNCLFVRAGTGAQCDCSPRLSMRNCTMIGGTLGADHWWGATWPVWIENCTFDGTSLTVNDNSGGNTNITYCDFNAFRTNANRLPVLGAHDQIVTNFNWQSSWLGNYYLPTNSSLINTGSVTADVVGLYHFTTQTNQVKETNSVVDIGYHYVAVDTNGNPIDTDGNSIPDYYEDANGNGVYDSGDYGDWISTTDYVTWYVNPGGNNAYSGLVPFWNGIDGPFATINTALAKPLSGNVVNVAAGTYAENVDLRAKNVQVQLNGNVTLH